MLLSRQEISDGLSVRPAPETPTSRPLMRVSIGGPHGDVASDDLDEQEVEALRDACNDALKR